MTAAGAWHGATAGYLVGFVVAAFVVGKMAEHGQDRRLSTSLPAFLVDDVVKELLAGALLPAAWHLVERRD